MIRRIRLGIISFAGQPLPAFSIKFLAELHNFFPFQVFCVTILARKVSCGKNRRYFRFSSSVASCSRTAETASEPVEQRRRAKY